MSERSTDHISFTIERHYSTPPEGVFGAWADPAKKRSWLQGPDEWERGTFELDFRVGGREVGAGGPADGPVHTYNAIYWDIVASERIIYTYEMLLDERRISVSLATVQFKPEAGGTTLTYTEQGAFLDGFEPEKLREEGMGTLLDNLGRVLDSTA